MTKLFLDIESFCETPITAGTYKYSSEAEVLIVTWAVDDGEVDFWDVTADKALPKRLYQVMMDQKTTIIIHNSNFDRTVLKAALGIDLATRRIHDTMVQALEHGLPGALGTLCEIFGIQSDKAKDKDGRRLINLFCKYLPANQKLRRATRETHPADWQKFIDYAKTDIKAMRELYKKIPNWNYKGEERDLWILDQKINDRGILVDVEFAKKAIELVNSTQAELSKQTFAATDGEVKSTNQRDELLAYILKEYGVELPDMTKSTVERRLNDPELPDGVKELLLLRTQASTSSTAKYKKLMACVSADGRLRGTMQFCGASRTGRIGHRNFQPGNLPRPQYKSEEINMFIQATKADCADLIFDDIMKYTSSALRGCIIAPEGKKLVVSDLSNIEGRIAAWLSNEEWKIKAFEDFDKGIGEDLYKLAYAKAFGKEAKDVTKDERQIGKCLELSMGYAGGVGAFLTFATAYGLNLDTMAEKMLPSMPQGVLKEATEFHGWLVSRKASTCGLKKDTFIFCDCLKRLWRYAHPNIVELWDKLEEAVRNAVGTPGKVFKARRLSVEKRGHWLYIVLPSGRLLCYPSMKIKDGKLVFKGVNQYSRKWGEINTFSGKLFENCCQSFAREIMFHAMPRVEAAGYLNLLSIHDELITEAPDNENYTAEHLSELLSTNPAWSEGLPLAAGGFTCKRYRKD
jgi:DNA polymerase